MTECPGDGAGRGCAPFSVLRGECQGAVPSHSRQITFSFFFFSLQKMFSLGWILQKLGHLEEKQMTLPWSLTRGWCRHCLWSGVGRDRRAAGPGRGGRREAGGRVCFPFHGRWRFRGRECSERGDVAGRVRSCSRALVTGVGGVSNHQKRLPECPLRPRQASGQVSEGQRSCPKSWRPGRNSREVS